ncbi:MAG: CHAP domain-containing protein [Bacteroidetes bacterium]|nr:CHAP domain-containing protein [Bacteroidota bacterium]
MRTLACLSGLIALFSGLLPGCRFVNQSSFSIGDKVDSLNGVYVYYNGSVSHQAGRHLTKDGYNLGLKYQCVEFVKRYYFQFYGHRMPNSYGNASDFFNPTLNDGELNKERGLVQFSNNSSEKPKVGDLLVFGATPMNKYGHVAIVAGVFNDELEIIQQNPGKFGSSRERIGLKLKSGKWQLQSPRIRGWLRLPKN